MAINPQLVSALLGMQSAPSGAMSGGMGGAAGTLAAFPFLAAGADIQRQQRQAQTQSTRQPMSSQFQNVNQRLNLAGMDVPALQALRRSLQEQGRLTPEASTAIFEAAQAQRVQ